MAQVTGDDLAGGRDADGLGAGGLGDRAVHAGMPPGMRQVVGLTVPRVHGGLAHRTDGCVSSARPGSPTTSIGRSSLRTRGGGRLRTNGGPSPRMNRVMLQRGRRSKRATSTIDAPRRPRVCMPRPRVRRPAAGGPYTTAPLRPSGHRAIPCISRSHGSHHAVARASRPPDRARRHPRRALPRPRPSGPRLHPRRSVPPRQRRRPRQHPPASDRMVTDLLYGSA